MRDDLLSIATGVWDFLKRHADEFDTRNWQLEWLGFLPGKRESRRYVGDHTITQADVEAGGPFADVIAYAGWSMDNHPPGGFYEPGEPTVFHPAPSPWGIPYRSIYSRNVANLLFAGRNISATHIALSSSRVMRTCAVIGQAAGTAAAIATRCRLTPREVGRERIDELQQRLLGDDAYLPAVVRRPTAVTKRARIVASNAGARYTVGRARSVYPDDVVVFAGGLRAGQRTSIEWIHSDYVADPEALRNGVDRTVDEADNGYWCAPGDTIEYRLDASPGEDDSQSPPRCLRIRFDSNLSRHYEDHRMKYHYPLDDPGTPVAETLVREFTVEVRAAGRWDTIAEVVDNRQRYVRVDLPDTPMEAVRLTPRATWGAPLVHLFALDLE